MKFGLNIDHLYYKHELSSSPFGKRKSKGFSILNPGYSSGVYYITRFAFEHLMGAKKSNNDYISTNFNDEKKISKKRKYRLKKKTAALAGRVAAVSFLPVGILLDIVTLVPRILYSLAQSTRVALGDKNRSRLEKVGYIGGNFLASLNLPGLVFQRIIIAFKPKKLEPKPGQEKLERPLFLEFLRAISPNGVERRNEKALEQQENDKAWSISSQEDSHEE